MFAHTLEEASDYLVVMLAVVCYLACMFAMTITSKDAGPWITFGALSLFVACPLLIYLILMSKLKHIMNMIAGNMH